MNGFEVTGVDVWPLKNPKPGTNLKANCRVTFNDALCLNCKLWNGKNGLFVGSDGRFGEKVNPETGKKPFYAAWVMKNPELQQMVNQAVINEFNKTTGNHTATTEQNVNPQMGGQIPF